MGKSHCYGLVIDSPELALPELHDADLFAEAQVRVGFGTVGRPVKPLRKDRATQWADRNEAILVFDPAVYLVRGGKEIIIDRAAGASDAEIRLHLLSTVLAVLLHQRGLLVLHASAASVDGEAVAFVAESGTGKSTLAAAFRARGHRLVADDIVPVEFGPGDAPRVTAGYPQLKLYPEAAAQLAGADATIHLLPDGEKSGWRAAGAFVGGLMPLRRIYALGDAESVDEIRELTPGQAFAALVQHTFVLGILKMTGSEREHFQKTTRLVGGPSRVKSLRRRRDLSALPAVVRMIEADLAAG
jgi:hypothetical protein